MRFVKLLPLSVIYFSEKKEVKSFTSFTFNVKLLNVELIILWNNISLQKSWKDKQ